MSKRKIISISCDRKQKNNSDKKAFIENKTRLYRFKGNFTWQGIKTEKYKLTDKDWSDIVRQTLIGNHGETSKFHLRYFEIAPGGYSSFEIHKHEHVVIGIRGRGVCTVSKISYEIGFLDTLYIEPCAPHQLRNPFSEPFGFFCIVNSRRDKPKAFFDQDIR